MGRRKKGRVFLSALMITMMIVSLLQGISFSQSNAKDSNWENAAEVTKDGIKVSKNVVGYNADTKDFDIELTVEVNGENEDAGIVNGTITDSMSDYVEFEEGTVDVFGDVKGSDEEKEKLATKVRDIEREIVGDNTLVVKKINLSKGETLKIRYKLNLKDERRDGKPYPVGGKTTLSTSPDGAVIEFNSPKVWESLTTRRLTIEKKWFTGVNENPKIGVYISKGDGLSQIIELDNEHLTESISLPVYDEEGNLCKYTVTEKLIDADAGKYESKAKLLPDNKSENANTISFSFDKIGDVIPNRKIVFANSVLNTEVIKVRKTWEGESAKEAKFELFSNSDVSKLMSGEGKTIETLTLTAANLAPGERNVWEGEFKTKRPFYEEGDTDYHSVFYGVAEIGDDGKRVTYHQDGLDKNNYANNVGFVKLGGNVYQVKQGLNCGCKKDPNTHYFINTKASKRNIEIRKSR